MWLILLARYTLCVCYVMAFSVNIMHLCPPITPTERMNLLNALCLIRFRDASGCDSHFCCTDNNVVVIDSDFFLLLRSCGLVKSTIPISGDCLVGCLSLVSCGQSQHHHQHHDIGQRFDSKQASLFILYHNYQSYQKILEQLSLSPLSIEELQTRYANIS